MASSSNFPNKSSIEEREESRQAVCTICLDIIENPSHPDTCGHIFCFHCIQKWAEAKAECPMCKVPFNSVEIDEQTTSTLEPGDSTWDEMPGTSRYVFDQEPAGKRAWSPSPTSLRDDSDDSEEYDQDHKRRRTEEILTATSDQQITESYQPSWKRKRKTRHRVEHEEDEEDEETQATKKLKEGETSSASNIVTCENPSDNQESVNIEETQPAEESASDINTGLGQTQTGQSNPKTSTTDPQESTESNQPYRKRKRKTRHLEKREPEEETASNQSTLHDGEESQLEEPCRKRRYETDTETEDQTTVTSDTKELVGSVTEEPKDKRRKKKKSQKWRCSLT